ncbi:MAG: hypothetical protein JKY60_02920 [Kordiimonadaceae bacterium]|nr:hypothetical protein [Kordiimonadaceae bacterium]
MAFDTEPTKFKTASRPFKPVSSRPDIPSYISFLADQQIVLAAETNGLPLKRARISAEYADCNNDGIADGARSETCRAAYVNFVDLVLTTVRADEAKLTGSKTKVTLRHQKTENGG